MKTVTVNLYTFDELTDKAKNKAREWWKRLESEEFGAHGELYEPYETAAKLLGIEFRQNAIRLHGGGTRNEPWIFWGLHTQGSGASFEGNYSYAKGAVRAIRKEFGSENTELLRIAKELQDLQKAHGYKLTAKITQSGNYPHKYSMNLEAYDATGNETEADVQDALLTLMRDFADYIYEGIQDEYEYRMNDENVEDAILANEYTFRADGTRSDD